MAVDLCGHLAPLVGGGAEVGALLAVGAMDVAVRSGTGLGIVPVFHHLGHGAGYAAGVDMAAGTAPPAIAGSFGAVLVVVAVLVPLGGDQGFHALGAFGGEEAAIGVVPLLLYLGFGLYAVFHGEVDHLAVVADPRGEVVGCVVE